MALSTEIIQAIRERADIVGVVGAVVSLKKQGRRYVGRCPFHDEKTPSFSVSPDKGLYYCFGCHAGGDAFSFVMRHEGLDFTSAARHLARHAGVQLEPESEAAQKRKKAETQLVNVNRYALAFFERALWNDTAGARRARAYLSERGLPEDLSRAWNLGYGGATGELADYFAAKNVPGPLIEEAGLLSDDKRHGLFDERLVFTITDGRDRIVGFGGRRLGEGFGGKYVNSRESILFKKRRLLYGLEKAAEGIRRGRRAVLVEGYMDVLACHRAGIKTAVAPLGTALTEDHVGELKRTAKEAVLLFDGDGAGVRASRLATVKVARAGMKALVAPLASGRDPDSLLREAGGDALVALVEGATPAVEHFIATSIESSMSIEQRADAATELAPLIHALSSGLERDLYTARLAEVVGVSVEQLKSHFEKARPQKPSAPPETPAPDVGSTAREAEVARPQRFEVKYLEELLLFPDLRPRLHELAEYVSDPMRLLLVELSESDGALADVLGRHLAPAWAKKLSAIAPATHDDDVHNPAERTYDDVLRRLKERHLDKAHKAMVSELKEAESRGEDTKELLRRIQNLTRRKRELKRPQQSGRGPAANET